MPPARHRLAAALVTGLVLALGAQSALGASALYWTNSTANTIGTAALDGTGARTTPVPGANYPRGVAVATRAGYVYWANNNTNTIGRARLDGSDADADFITGADGPSGVAADDTYVYWADTGNGHIARARLDGTGVDPDFILGANQPTGVAVDAGHVYWANYGIDTIGRANLDGTGVNQNFISAGPEPHGVTAGATHLYWTNYSGGARIGRANLDGTGVNTNLISLPGLLFYLADDAGHVYWANYGTDTIGRANLDGTGVDNDLVTGATGPFAVAAASWEPAATLAGDGAFASRAPGTASDARTFTLASTGTGALKVGAVGLAGADASQFSLGADTCSGRWLAVGATCTVAVGFAPTSAGAKTARVEVTSDAAGSPAVAALSGTATVPASAPTPLGPPSAVFAGATQSAADLARATIRIRTGGPGTVSVTARAVIAGRPVALRSTPVTTTAAATVAVPLALPPAVRARLAAAGRVPLDLVTRTTGPNGQTLTVAADGARPSLLAARSRVLAGQWIGRTLGPWAHAPRLTGARSTALSVSRRGDAYTARVVR